MKGIRQVVVLMLSWVQLQRWLLIVGLLMIASGFLGYHGEPTAVGYLALVVLGLAFAFISPLCVSGILFQAISAPRTMRLVPYGRLQLLLGALATQLLIALVIAIALASVLSVTPIRGEAVPLGWIRIASVAFVGAFGALTVCFLAWFIASRSRFGYLAFLPLLTFQRSLSTAFSSVYVPGFRSAASEVMIVLAVILFAWVVFSAWYLGESRIAMLKGGASTRPPLLARDVPVRSEREDALRIYLTGSLSDMRCVVPVVFFCLAILGYSEIVSSLRSHAPNERGPSTFGILVPMMAVFAGAATFAIVRRAKSLWLRGGVGRSELFELAETQAWRGFFAVGGTALLIFALVQAVLAHLGRDEVMMLLTQGASGVSVLYLGLLCTRAWPPTDKLIAATAFLLWVVELIVTLIGGGWTQFAAVAVSQFAFILMLRELARRRWAVIDWLICKPHRAGALSLRPVR